MELPKLLRVWFLRPGSRRNRGTELVEIKLVGDSKDPKRQDEFKAAQALREILEGGFQKGESGQVLILFNLKVYGSKCKDIDLLVFGSFTPSLQRRIVCRTGGKQADDELRAREVSITSFCSIIEVKTHDSSGIRFRGSQAEVIYDGEWHDVSNQSHEQNTALRIFLEDTIDWTPPPYITNLIWFTCLDRDSLKLHKQNFLPQQFSFLELMTLVCRQALPFQLGSGSSAKALMKCTKSEADEVETYLNKSMAHFSEISRAVGKLTRTKLEAITKRRLLKQQGYVQSLGQRLVIVRGRAGTGKTMKLLHMAHDLATGENHKCLILTYNLALVSDIRRLVALANIDKGIPVGKLNIQTIHSLLLRLMDHLGIPDEEHGVTFSERYETRRHLLFEYLQVGLISRDDLKKNPEGSAQSFAWDFLLIDEGQDWPEEERTILFYLFDSRSFVVADGIDQLVRSQKSIDWALGVEHHKPIVSEKISLRQKANLVSFQSLLAAELGTFWEIQANAEAPGGRVVILEGDYSPRLHQDLFEQCVASENNAYEMMFLVPPALVAGTGSDDRYFRLAELWESKYQIRIWDGTSSSRRSEYPTLLDEHRLFQYDSCRGLEGWTVVCLWLDEFFEYKKRTYVDDGSAEQLALRTRDEEANLFAARWITVPLTRAVDTIVIALRHSDSALAKALRRVASQCPDVVQWIKSPQTASREFDALGSPAGVHHAGRGSSGAA
jgi:hypothetical protein